MAKTQRKTIDKVFILLGVVTTVVLLSVGGVASWGRNFVISNTQSELRSQKIYFPLKGSPALDPAEFPDLQQYAGQMVDTGPKARAYADGFIGRHVQKIAGGKTYAEVSTLALQNPTNQTLQQQKQTLFQGETLRGLLLSSYVYWTIGTLAGYMAMISFVGAGVMVILVLLGLAHLSRLR